MSGKSVAAVLPGWQQAFLDRNRLAPSYLAYARRWFAPLAEALAEHLYGAGAPLVVALNGCQGSGKTTACDYLQDALREQHALSVLTLSLDDFYLTRAQRSELATAVHPLLATRGVPGTHDIDLLNTTLDALLAPGREQAVPIPRFDKASDDRRPRVAWDAFEGGLDLVLLEGWCLGARPQAAVQLQQPVNDLERSEDRDGIWRAYVNDVLARDFVPLYRRVDCWVMLQAPSFDCVYRWRREQEHKLRQDRSQASGVMDDHQLARFVCHYQRLTEHCLATLPPAVDYLYKLDEQRRISASRPAWETTP